MRAVRMFSDDGAAPGLCHRDWLECDDLMLDQVIQGVRESGNFSRQDVLVTGYLLCCMTLMMKQGTAGWDDC